MSFLPEKMCQSAPLNCCTAIGTGSVMSPDKYAASPASFNDFSNASQSMGSVEGSDSGSCNARRSTASVFTVTAPSAKAALVARRPSFTAVPAAETAASVTSSDSTETAGSQSGRAKASSAVSVSAAFSSVGAFEGFTVTSSPAACSDATVTRQSKSSFHRSAQATSLAATVKPSLSNAKSVNTGASSAPFAPFTESPGTARHAADVTVFKPLSVPTSHRTPPAAASTTTPAAQPVNFKSCFTIARRAPHRN